MISPSVPAFAITVSGTSGSGKSSTVRAIAKELGEASCFYFDDYGEGMQQPDNGLDWIASGADVTAFVLPRFGADVARLKHGETVTLPTGRRVEPAPFIVIEEPFGSGRTDMKGLVDFSICIDAPMDVALTRRLLDTVEKWSGPADERMKRMGQYLNSYLFEGMREFYTAINGRVRQHCHMILDGLQPVQQNARNAVGAIRHMENARKV